MTKKEGAAASSALFLWVARFASGNGISPCKTALSRSPQAPSLFRPALVKVSPGIRDFSIRQRIKNGCSPMLHPSPKQLISFSAGNLRAPPSPLPRGCAKGPQPLRLPSAGGGVYPAEERFFHPSAHKKRMKPNAPSVPETSADGKSLPLHQNPCAATPCTDFDAPLAQEETSSCAISVDIIKRR